MWKSWPKTVGEGQTTHSDISARTASEETNKKQLFHDTLFSSFWVIMTEEEFDFLGLCCFVTC